VHIAVDATPLLGAPTGVGALVRGAVGALAGRVRLSAYALSWRGRRGLAARVPAGVGVVRRPMAAGPLLASWERVDWPSAEWWTGPVDVVHGTNFVVPPARRAGRVVTVHDLTAVRYPELCTATTRRYPALVRRAAAHGALVHVTTAFGRDEVVDLLGVPAERVAAVAPGVPAVAEAPVPAGGPPSVLALGTVEPRKDLPTLVRAFAAVAADHPDVELVLAGGDGWGGAVEALDAALAALPPSGRARVRRLGRVDDATRAALLRGAAVLAYPSVYEGFGFAPLEAMSVGVPVVATAAAALPETLGNAAILVPPGDPDALAGALARALADEECRRRLSEAGRARAATYSWDACADGFVALYARAAGER
jgi:glycosyltransferase involved in cell wall biosynthesis